ncbi:polyketide synthase [Diplocarpon rosae]|nr:polyketide synthase [Diplocarpon rosae]
MKPTNGSTVKFDDDAIAVIGLSCRFPGEASTPQSFWDMLSNGRGERLIERFCPQDHGLSANAAGAAKIPSDRWTTEGYHHDQKGRRSTIVTPQGYFLKDDVTAFDAEFFRIPQNEAVAMDPQQRIMLEVVYETFENAGLRIEDVTGSQTACYVGAFTSDWREIQFRDLDSAPTLAVTGSGIELLANRTSWFYDLRGPSVTVSTACSASMVSIHLACQSLRSGEASMAIAGGANLFLSPEVFALLTNQNFLSPDGMCKSFDADGNGYARGEGAASILLKRAKDAIRDGDTIRAIVRGSGSNQDGKTPTMTMPNGAAQADLIRATYKSAGLDPAATHYCEAHGTGTAAGDPAELSGLAQTLCHDRDPGKPLYVGSVKTNIGHLESVAGLAGVIKAILVLEAGVIPPSLNFNTPNPKILFREWNITVPTKATPWPYTGPRRASVNSFGYGGANAHVILEDAYHFLAERNLLQRGNHRTRIPAYTNGYPNGAKVETAAPTRPFNRHVFTLSTSDEEGIGRMSADLAEYLKTHTDSSVARDLAHTLGERRSRFPWKSFYSASSLPELQEALATNSGTSKVSTKVPKLGFVFTGQGAQWARMGHELSQFEVARASIEEADKYLREVVRAPWSAVEELAKADSYSNIHQPLFSQPLCTVVQVALVDLLASWNVNPVAVVGHSSGEIGAAYCLGALSKQDAWKAAYFRGYLCSQRQLAGKKSGSMMAVGASRERVQEFTGKATTGSCLVACVNSPTSVTVSGDSQAVEEVREMLQKEGIFARPLKVQAAYHSHHMATLAGPYLDALSDLETLPGHAGRSMFSSVIGDSIEPDELGATNWVRNLISPVLFSDAVTEMTKAIDIDLFVEIGPHPALKGPVRQIAGNETAYLSTLSRGIDAVESLLDFAGNAFIHGVPIDLSRVNGNGNLINDLPSYPWNHTRKFWSESRISKTNRLRRAPRGSLLGAPYAPTTSRGQLWRGFIRVSEEPWIKDHSIQSSILYPAAGFISMAIEAARQASADPGLSKAVSSYLLKDVHIDSALVLAETSDAECIIELRPAEPEGPWQRFSISASQDGGKLQEHCSGLILLEFEPLKGSSAALEKALEDQGRVEAYQHAESVSTQIIDCKKFYENLSSIGMAYGPAFRNVQVVRVGDWTSVCTLMIPGNQVVNSPQVSVFARPHIIHPTVLDAMLHAAFAASMGAGVNEAAVPSSIREIAIDANMPYVGGSLLQGFSTNKRHGYSAFVSDIDFLDTSMTKPLVKIAGLRCVKVASIGAAQSTAGSKSIASQILWTPVLSLSPGLLPGSPNAIRPLDTLIPEMNPGERDKSLEGLVSHGIRHALKSVSPNVVPSVKLRDMYDWLLQKIEVATSPSAKKRIDFLDGQVDAPEISIEDYLSTIEEPGEQTILDHTDLQYFLPRLESLLRGEPQVLESGSDRVLPALVGAREAVSGIVQTLKSFTLWKPGSHVLLLDFGLDNLTQQVLSEIQSAALLDSATLTYASPSAPALARAEESFPSVTSISLTFEQDFASQTLKEASFDAIFVSGGLLFTQKDINAALGKLRSLLRPSGALYTVELTRPRVSSLPTLLGWPDVWAKSVGPSPFGASPRAAWESALSSNGFQVDFAFPEQDDGSATSEITLFGASVSSGRPSANIAQITLLQPAAPSERVQKLARGITEALRSISIRLVTGLARTLKNEVAGIDFRVLHLSTVSEDVAAPSVIAKLAAAGPGEDEYLLRRGVLHTNRILEDQRLDKHVSEMLHHQSSDEIVLSDARGPLRLAIGQPGLLDSLCFHEDPTAGLPLLPDEVEIEVKATGLNFRDVMVCLGQIPDEKLGFEASGLVRRVGSGVTRFQRGDAVCVLGHGAHRTLFRSKDLFCQHKPAEMSFEEAAGLPLVHATAYHALVNVGRLEKGQSVLIHAAAGGVGQAAVQLAQHLGLRVYATVGSPEKKKLLRDLRPELMGQILEKTFALLRGGVTRGVFPQHSYPVSQVEDAFRLMASGKHQGKITISYPGDARIPVELDPGSAIDLSQGTYVLVGGLGGLGRSLARLLADLGARHLAFISRSGSLTEPPAVAALVEELRGRSVRVSQYQADISREEALRSALERLGRENPPLAGVIQGAMVLRDNLFSSLSHRQWSESLAPKVQGTLNLAKMLPAHLDFFILLSSFSGIFGNLGQSNYAAGCTFQDATAHALRAQGRRAVSIDLGIMRDVGVLAEQGAKGHHLRDWAEPFGLGESEFHALLKTVISGVGRDPANFPAQIVTGLATGGTAARAGIPDPFYLGTSKFLPMRRAGKSSAGSGSDATVSVLAELAGADTWEKRARGVPVSTFDLLKSSPISALCAEIAQKSQDAAK